MLRRHVKLFGRLAVLVVVASTVVLSDPAVARTAPETLADRRPVGAGPMEPGFPIDFVGVLWSTPPGYYHADEDAGPEPHGAVRFRHHGAWGPWVPLIEDGAAGARGGNGWASGLVAAADAEAYQVRGVPADAANPQAVAINTTDGRPVQIGQARGGTARAITSAKCQSRSDWGADEKLRFDATGNEVWPPAHYPVQVATVHHTATKNNDSDPEATVRAIYRYHAVDNGWGDIGYHYLVDESGVVYEGRWSGTRSASCELEGGDGADFAHEALNADGDNVVDEMTTAGHTGGSNSGNLGLALLGQFTTNRRTGGTPKAAAVTALEDVLAELGRRHRLDPLARVTYVNPVDGEQRAIDTISAHRDWLATECPGEKLYEKLPTIRSNVAAKMAATDGGRGGTGDTGGSTTMHVGDLDGTATTTKSEWYATVSVSVLDAIGTAVAGAIVQATWTTVSSATTCTTDASGTCTLTSPRVRKATDSLTLRVDSATHASLTYDAGANTDPDGDSNGSTITVRKPA